MQTRYKDSYLIYFCFLLSLVFLFLDTRSKLTFLHNAASIVNPVQSRLFTFKNSLVSPFFLFINGKDSNKIYELETKLALKDSQIASLKAVEEENFKTRKLLGSDLPPSWQFAVGRVIGSIADTLNVVSDYNIPAGTPVIFADETLTKSGIFIGKVERTFGKTYEVVLPTFSSSKIAVVVRAASGDIHSNGIVVGKGGKMMLSQVLTSDKLDAGDLVLTAGSGFPQDLLIGYVGKVSSNTNLASYEAEVLPAIKTQSLDYIFFVIKY